MEAYNKFKSKLFSKKEELKIKYGESYKVKYFGVLKEALNKYLGYNIENVRVIMEELYKEGIISENEYNMYEDDCDITVSLLEKLNSGIVEQILTQSKKMN